MLRTWTVYLSLTLVRLFSFASLHLLGSSTAILAHAILQFSLFLFLIIYMLGPIAGCVIRAARETAALMFGVPVSEMLGKNLSDFLLHACPSRNAEDMLMVGDATANVGTKRGGLGGKKKVVGKLMPLVSTNTSRDFDWQELEH